MSFYLEPKTVCYILNPFTLSCAMIKLYIQKTINFEKKVDFYFFCMKFYVNGAAQMNGLTEVLYKSTSMPYKLQNLISLHSVHWGINLQHHPPLFCQASS